MTRVIYLIERATELGITLSEKEKHMMLRADEPWSPDREKMDIIDNVLIEEYINYLRREIENKDCLEDLKNKLIRTEAKIQESHAARKRILEALRGLGRGI